MARLTINDLKIKLKPVQFSSKDPQRAGGTIRPQAASRHRQMTAYLLPILIWLVLLGSAGCTSAGGTDQPATGAPPSSTPAATQTATPMPVDLPTSTLIPTDTASPTPTPTITPTITPTPPGGGSGKIVFRSDRDGNQEIYVMNADGSQPTRLTDSPGSDMDPDWAP